jgi:hypothetical protein
MENKLEHISYRIEDHAFGYTYTFGTTRNIKSVKRSVHDAVLLPVLKRVNQVIIGAERSVLETEQTAGIIIVRRVVYHEIRRPVSFL